MARFKLCKHCGDLHQVGRVPSNCRDEPWPRSDLPAPHVIRDQLGGINGVFHHGALTRFDSKRRFRQATRDHGLIEVGDERPQDKPREHIYSNTRELERDVAETVQFMEQKGMTADEAA
ncbi:hypothetical protein [Vitreimonas flagellata]|uniref:hypothetical protein n=1 Tax=Vitreimonas flagellata TaxID=2560861 RepID=UPI0010757973|nr:hypothetical protein [Vitreimonas flagellata]